MQGVLPYPYEKKFKKYRRIAYTVVIVFGLLNIFFPCVAHADLFGFYTPDVYEEITENVTETNDILNKAFIFSQTSPYEVVNTLSPSGSTGKIAVAVRTASKTMALVVATLLLMVEFFRKTVNFEWSSKWENILLFLIKIIVIKQVIQNADTIIGTIYSMFDSINRAATGTSPEYLPNGNMRNYVATVPLNMIEQMKKGWWDYWVDIGMDRHQTKTFSYNISPDAVKMFFPNASLPTTTEFNDIDDFINAFPSPTSKINFFPTWELTKLQPLFLIMKAIAYVIFVIVIGRVFELSVYTIFAPLPLATFASDTSCDVAKSFLKNYIATVIQIAVIVIMFVVYAAMNNYIVGWMTVQGFGATKLINFIILCALGLGVMRSGSWSKKICGIG